MNNARKKFVDYLLLILFLLWTGLILGLSFATGEESTQQSNFVSDIIVRFLHLFGVSLDNPSLNELHFWVRKLIGHFGLFAIDGFLGQIVFTSFWKQKPRYPFLWVMLGGTIIAVLSEIVQLFTPDRAGMFQDTVIDLLGFAFGVLMTMGISQWWAVKKTTH